jgi:opacity protein-like surface antigen
VKFLTIGRAAPLGLLLAANQAFAQSQSADVEFVRPSFGYGSFQGVDVPMVRSPKAFRYGTLIQFQRDPLTLYNADTQQEIGAVVTNRANLSFGVSVDLSERFSMNLLLPTAYNWGTEIQEFSADGFGLGDIGVGTRLIMLKTRRDAFNIGFRGGLTLPTGRQDAWLGESGVRVGAGLLAAANMGPVRLATDVGVGTRTELVTDEDFRLGTELLWGNGLRVALPAAMRTAFTAQVLMRTGFKDFLQGGAETGLEAMGGVQFLPSSNVTIDVGAGRGFNEGYGTTDMRILSQLTIQSVAAAAAVVLRSQAPPQQVQDNRRPRAAQPVPPKRPFSQREPSTACSKSSRPLLPAYKPPGGTNSVAAWPNPCRPKRPPSKRASPITTRSWWATTEPWRP